MNEELDKILIKVLELDENTKIDDSIFVGSITEWDSLSHMNLIYALSNEYEIKITFKDLKGIDNWGQLKEFIINKKK